MTTLVAELTKELKLPMSDFYYLLDVQNGEKELDDNWDLYEKLYEYFVFVTNEMPYGTAKGKTGDPMEWIHERLESELYIY